METLLDCEYSARKKNHRKPNTLSFGLFWPGKKVVPIIRFYATEILRNKLSEWNTSPVLFCLTFTAKSGTAFKLLNWKGKKMKESFNLIPKMCNWAGALLCVIVLVTISVLQEVSYLLFGRSVCVSWLLIKTTFFLVARPVWIHATYYSLLD